MTDFASRIERARAQIVPDWNEERARDVERAMLSRKRRRTQTRAAVGTALLLAVVGGAAWKLWPRSVGLHFVDGSRAEPLEPDTLVRETPPEPGLQKVEVVRGSARFEVKHDASRRFRVQAGEVNVDVVGTRFLVERRAERVRVAVEHGRVRVAYREDRVELADGESAWFPREQVQAPARPSAEPRTVEAPAPTPQASRPAWGALAKRGEFDRAWAALLREGPGAVRDDAGDLLLAADVARFSHHPADAVAPLERLLARHRRDSRAPLAAFTLGRVLLEELRRPGDAADAFAQARALAPTGPLAEDALAREVEAASRAGHTSRARELAKEYRRLYPNGRREAAVRRYGGME